MLSQLLPMVLVNHHLALLILLILLDNLLEADAANTLEERCVDDLGQYSISLHHYLVVKGFSAIGF